MNLPAIISIILLAASIHTAYAQPIFIGVVTSDTCKKSITCLGMKELIPLDTSDQSKSGKFILKDGVMVRAKPAIKNHYAFYQYDKRPYIIFIEPDAALMMRAKIIKIESSQNMVYIKQSDSTIINNTFYQYENRIIKDCSESTISSNLELLKDTIQFLGNDCHTKTKYTETKKTVKPITQHKDCSWACMKEKWMKQAKAEAKKGFGINPNIKLKKSNDKVRVNG